jgi:hypothetical protein
VIRECRLASTRAPMLTASSTRRVMSESAHLLMSGPMTVAGSAGSPIGSVAAFPAKRQVNHLKRHVALASPAERHTPFVRQPAAGVTASKPTRCSWPVRSVSTYSSPLRSVPNEVT